MYPLYFRRIIKSHINFMSYYFEFKLNLKKKWFYVLGRLRCQFQGGGFVDSLVTSLRGLEQFINIRSCPWVKHLIINLKVLPPGLDWIRPSKNKNELDRTEHFRPLEDYRFYIVVCRCNRQILPPWIILSGAEDFLGIFYPRLEYPSMYLPLGKKYRR